MDRLANVAELFEMVLLELPIKDLLINCPRVSKHWQASIANSPRFQQALFFKPLPGVKPLTLTKTGAHDAAFAQSKDDPYAYTVLLNPFYSYLRQICNISYLSDSKRMALMREDASWRRMQATQPPTYTKPGDHEPYIKKSGCVTMEGLLYKEKHPIKRGHALKLERLNGAARCRQVERGAEVRKMMRKKAYWM